MMSTTIPVSEAEGKLAELIAGLAPGEEVVLTRDDRPVARLVGSVPPSLRPRQPGLGKGKLVILSDDDEHLEDFAEYM